MLRVNLAATHRAFFFVVTIGHELTEWAGSQTGILERFWADLIAEAALRTAVAVLQADIHARFSPGPLSMMNPGSLEDWPLTEQHALFAILGDRVEALGVFYASDNTFESCQLCPIENCPNRRAAHDDTLFHNKYGLG